MSISELSQIGGPSADVAISGSYGYVCAGTRLEAVNISTPNSPTLTASILLPDVANRVIVSGNTAYVADRDGGLQIFDLTVPSNPSYITTYTNASGGIASDVAISGTRAYVAETFYLDIVDISNRAAPKLLGTTTGFGHQVDRVAVSGVLVYALDDQADMLTYTASNPAAIVYDGSYADPSGGYARAIVASVPYVYIGANSFDIINASIATSPVRIGFYNNTPDVEDIQLSGSTAYVADNFGLHILNVSNPTAPTSIGNALLGGVIGTGISVAGSLALVSAGDAGLQVVNISLPSAPTLLASFGADGSAQRATISGTHAFVAEGDRDLQILDISNPANPTHAGSYVISPSIAPQSSAYDVCVSGNTAFVADGEEGLQVIDVSNVSSPVLLGRWDPRAPSQFDTSLSADGVAVLGGFAYVAEGSAGLRIINVSNPAAPVLVGTYDTAGFATGVAISGTTAYVADGTDGLQMINVSNPASPTLLGSINTGSYALRVVLISNFAYVADSSGLQIIDVSNPASPVLRGQFNNGAEDISVSGSLACISNISTAEILNVSNPSAPLLVSRSPGFALSVIQSVVLSGSHIYAACGNAGFVIYQATTVAPTVTSGTFIYDATQSVKIQFDQDVSASLTSDDLQLHNLTDGQTYTIGFLAKTSGSDGATIATWSSFPGFSLPDGNYHAVLAASSITNVAGAPLAADFTLDFFVLAGDANRDRHVNSADTAITTANLGKSGTFSTGDFNYDQTVNSSDLTIVQNEQGFWLPPEGALSVPAIAGSNSYRLVRESTTTVDLFVNSFGIPSYRIAQGAADSLSFAGGTGNDALTLDCSNAPAFPAGGFSYDGQTGTNILDLLGATGTHNMSVTSSAVTYDGISVPYANIQQVFVDPGGGTDALSIAGTTASLPAVSRHSGIVPRTFSTLTIDANGTLLVPATSNLDASLDHADRSVVILTALSDSGTLDLGDSDMLISNGGAGLLATVTNLVRLGFNSGGSYWSGKGIRSSIAAADTTRLTSLGVSLNPSNNGFDGQNSTTSDVLVKYTYYGEADLNGTINGADYHQIDSGIGLHKTGWSNGDFNYDGVVNGSDYALIDNAVNQLAATNAAPLAVMTNPTTTAPDVFNAGPKIDNIWKDLEADSEMIL